MSHLLLEQLYFIDIKIPLALGSCKQPGQVPPAIREKQLWEWSLLTLGLEPHAACKQLTEKAPEITAPADQAPAPEITAKGHQGMHPFPVNPLHTVLLSNPGSLGFGIWQF